MSSCEKESRQTIMPAGKKKAEKPVEFRFTDRETTALLVRARNKELMRESLPPPVPCGPDALCFTSP